MCKIYTIVSVGIMLYKFFSNVGRVLVTIIIIFLNNSYRDNDNHYPKVMEQPVVRIANY